MRKASSCCSLLAGLVVTASVAAGCAADVGGEADIETTTAALTAGRSYLVSFSGGGIPANASSLIAGAGGTLVARYNAVGAADTVKSSIAPVAMKKGKHHPPHPVPPAAGDPLSPQQWDMDQIRAPQARSITMARSP